MNRREYEQAFRDRTAKAYQVYRVLRGRRWCCRVCRYGHVDTTQIAGSGGIKGLRNGTRSRDGLDIESAYRHCRTCGKRTRQDRWTGKFVSAVPAGSVPAGFTKRALEIFDLRDVVEMARRPPTQLTVDHKLPRIRWSRETESIQNDYAAMTDDDIRRHFQLLKRSNGAVSHNLLKSRACETCFRTGQRGTPFGIRFFHHGGAAWEAPSKRDPSGCIGCGWFDFAEWREALNRAVGTPAPSRRGRTPASGAAGRGGSGATKR